MMKIEYGRMEDKQCNGLFSVGHDVFDIVYTSVAPGGRVAGATAQRRYRRNA